MNTWTFPGVVVQMKSGTGSLLAYTRSCYETRPVSLGFSFFLFCPTGDGSIEDLVQIIREIVQFVARIIGRIMFFFECPIFSGERRCFLDSTSVPFSYDVSTCDDATVAREAAVVGKKVFFHLCEMSPT